MLKKFYYTSVAAATLCLSAASGFAADLPHRSAPAPVYIAPVAASSWSGCYAGAAGGYVVSRGRSKVVDTVNTDTTTQIGTAPPAFGGDPSNGAAVLNAVPASQRWGQNGGLLGVTLGCNYQMNNVVLGLEGDISLLGVRGHEKTSLDYVRSLTASGSMPAIAPLPVVGAPSVTAVVYPTTIETFEQNTLSSSRQNWLGTARVRAGFLVTPQTLLYATGGLAFGGVKDTIDMSGTVADLQDNPPNAGAPPVIAPTPGTGTLGKPWSSVATRSKTRLGWALGAGVEQMVSKSWSIKGEYLYYNLGSTKVTNDLSAAVATGNLPTTPTVTVTERFKHDGHIIRVGANYHF